MGLGVLLGLTGSVLINVGNNVQARSARGYCSLAIATEPATATPSPSRPSQLWPWPWPSPLASYGPGYGPRIYPRPDPNLTPPKALGMGMAEEQKQQWMLSGLVRSRHSPRALRP
eukprot:scaffold113591_cov55-Phaeocystis_antarctica.AAC.1